MKKRILYAVTFMLFSLQANLANPYLKMFALQDSLKAADANQKIKIAQQLVVLGTIGQHIEDAKPLEKAKKSEQNVEEEDYAGVDEKYYTIRALAFGAYILGAQAKDVTKFFDKRLKKASDHQHDHILMVRIIFKKACSHYLKDGGDGDVAKQVALFKSRTFSKEEIEAYLNDFSRIGASGEIEKIEDIFNQVKKTQDDPRIQPNTAVDKGVCIVT